MDITEACERFNEIAVPLLEGAGISTEDPDRAAIEAAYDACVEDRIQAYLEGVSADDVTEQELVDI